MATLYEHYNTGDNNAELTDALWVCSHTFTPQITHNITLVKLKVYRLGNPGTITVGIRATSGGVPTGSNLTSGAFNGDAITTDGDGDWIEVELTPYRLSVSTKYAIVLTSLAEHDSNSLYWRSEANSPIYTRGALCWSNDGGLSWTEYPNQDMMFEEWGNPVAKGNPNVDQLLYRHVERIE